MNTNENNNTAASSDRSESHSAKVQAIALKMYDINANLADATKKSDGLSLLSYRTFRDDMSTIKATADDMDLVIKSALAGRLIGVDSKEGKKKAQTSVSDSTATVKKLILGGFPHDQIIGRPRKDLKKALAFMEAKGGDYTELSEADLLDIAALTAGAVTPSSIAVAVAAKEKFAVADAATDADAVADAVAVAQLAGKVIVEGIDRSGKASMILSLNKTIAELLIHYDYDVILNELTQQAKAASAVNEQVAAM